ncbi:GGDEF domain-containing protein [Azohydromonas lata]|uniref:Diguanylate cyclase n=1 Tax=Azohydromonas lata TaxID=45677 RepID=A0ABU5IIJ8_9BURK|nr:diguanylate cyclase [Azohydromonas lata]MDZ5458475.1 diguanylate cyclase [Azohydromonas lata]
MYIAFENKRSGACCACLPSVAHMHMLYKIARILRLTQLAALLLVIGLGAALYAVLLQYKAAGQAVDHSHEVLNEIEQVRTNSLRAGVWLRSYGMYASKDMLPRVRKSAASATEAAARLQALTAADALQGPRVQLVMKELDEVMSIYLVSADIAQQQGPETLREMTIAQTRLDITAGLRTVLDQIEMTERDLLAARRTVEEERRGLSEALLLTVGGAFVAIMFWTMRYSGQLIRLGQQEVDQLQDAALLDPLTGLLNRRGLHKWLAKMATKGPGEAGIAVLAFDLDDFKLVNDHYSHDAGDQVLKAITQRLQQQFRSGDAVARVGGDEFIAVLPCVASRQEAAAIARRTCARLCRPIQLAPNVEVCVGASVGVAMLHEDGQDIDALLHAADKRMYMAKGTRKAQASADAAVAEESALA